MTTSDWPLGAMWLIVVLAVAVKLFCAWQEDRDEEDARLPHCHRIWRRRPHHQRRRRRARA